MKLALCSGSFETDVKNGNADIFDLLDIARSRGFQGFEIRNDLLTGSREELLKLGRISADSGMALIYAIKVWLLNSKLTTMKEAAEGVVKGINAAYACGAGIIKLGFGTLEDPQRLADGHLEIIRELSRYARKHRTTLCLENSDKAAGSNPELIKKVMDRADDMSLRVTYDCGNFSRVGHDPVAALRLLSSYIAYVHLKDYTAGNENTTWLGNGNIDFASIFTLLEDGSYQGYCCFEFPMGLERLDEIDKSLKHIERIHRPYDKRPD